MIKTKKTQFFNYPTTIRVFCAVLLLNSYSIAVASISFPKHSLPYLLQNHSHSVDGKVEQKNWNKKHTNHIRSFNAENALHVYFSTSQVDFKTQANQIWSSRLISYGYDDLLTEVAHSSEPEISGNTIYYQHNSSLIQWYINSVFGFEHGLTLAKAPPKQSSEHLLAFHFQVLGNVSVALNNDQELLVSDRHGAPLITHSGLAAFDKKLNILPTSVAVKDNSYSIYVDDSSATYPIYVDPLFTREKIIEGESAGDQFGRHVDISNNFLVVGAPHATKNSISSGSVYIYHKDSGGLNNWGHIKTLLASDASSDADFGYTVAISESIIAIGAPNDNAQGAVYIFQRDEGGSDNWGQVKKIVPADIAIGDEFGASVHIANDTLAVGTPGDDDLGLDSGSVYIFYAHEAGVDSWEQVNKITSNITGGGDLFGTSVSIHGDTLAVGAPGSRFNGVNSGSAFIYYRNRNGADAWGQVISLNPDPTTAYAEFGKSVSLFNNEVVVGAPFDLEGENTTKLGVAYVFSRHEGGTDNWGKTNELTGTDVIDSDNFGISVSIYEDYIGIGANKDQNNGQIHGAAYIFNRISNNPTAWEQMKKLRALAATSESPSPDNPFKGNSDPTLYGVSVAIVSDSFAVGGHEDILNSSGTTYIYNKSVDIGLSGSATDPTESGDSVHFNYEVKNLDPELSSTGVKFNLTLNSAFSNILATSSLGICDVVNQTISCDIGTIDSNADPVDIEVIAEINEFGKFDSVAEITGDQSDANEENNSLTLEVTLTDSREIDSGLDIGGGCTIGSGNTKDITLVVLVCLAFSQILRRRRQQE